MKKLFALSTSLFVVLFSVPLLFPAYAGNLCPPGYEALCKLDPGTNPNFIGNLIQILIIIAICLSVIFLVWGGIKWIMSGGDKGKVEHARSAIIASLVGLIISFLAYFIVGVIVQIATGNDIGNLQILKLVP